MRPTLEKPLGNQRTDLLMENTCETILAFDESSTLVVRRYELDQPFLGIWTNLKSHNRVKVMSTSGSLVSLPERNRSISTTLSHLISRPS